MTRKRTSPTHKDSLTVRQWDLAGGSVVKNSFAIAAGWLARDLAQTIAATVAENLFVTDADIRPDPSAGVLHVEIHRGSRPVTDRTLSALLEQLNEMEITFPGTELILRYALLGSPPAVSP